MDRAAISPRCGGARTLAFTFQGLVIASVLYSMPFVVQPLQQAFEAIDEMKAERIVVDLRGNGGGLLNEGVEVAGHYLARGQVALARGLLGEPRAGKGDHEEGAEDEGDEGEAAHGRSPFE